MRIAAKTDEIAIKMVDVVIDDIVAIVTTVEKTAAIATAIALSSTEPSLQGKANAHSVLVGQVSVACLLDLVLVANYEP